MTIPQTPAATRLAPSDLGAQITRRTEQTEASALLWAMTVYERVVAMRNGTLSFAQCMEWARRAPGQIPLLEDEWEFIARDTPEVAEIAAGREL